MSPGFSQTPSEEPEAEHPSVSHSGLDNLEFPDFDFLEMETAEGEAVDIGALELEIFDLVSADLPVRDDCSLIGFEEPQPDLLVCDPFDPLMRTSIQDLNLGSQNIIALDPASFPEPIHCSAFPELAVAEQWSQSEEVITDPLSSTQADETDLGDAESHAAAQETDNVGPAYLNDGIQSHPR